MDFSQFDEYYAFRHEPEVWRQSLDVLESELKRSQTYGWLWRGARSRHFAGMRFWEEKDRGAAGEEYREGEALAARAYALNQVGVEGNFWMAVCGLEAAHARGVGASVLALGAAEKRMERAAAIDETYHFAGPKRVLGRVTQVRPLLLGGSLTRALAFYERALQIAPDNSTTLLYYADALLYHKEPGPARRALHRILSLQPVRDWVWETRRDQKEAQKWLIDRLD